LWYQFALSSRSSIPVETVYDTLCVFYIKEKYGSKSQKVRELREIIEDHIKRTFKDRERKLVAKQFDQGFLRYKTTTPREIMSDFLQLNLKLGEYKITNLYSKQTTDMMSRSRTQLNLKPSIKSGSSLNRSRSKVRFIDTSLGSSSDEEDTRRDDSETKTINNLRINRMASKEYYEEQKRKQRLDCGRSSNI